MAQSVRISSFREKHVVSTRSGRNLGTVRDLEIDPSDGKVISIMVERRKGLFGLFGADEMVFRWSDVSLVGEDTVLVDGDLSVGGDDRGSKKGFTLFE